MADITPRLKSVKEGITKLVKLAGNDQAEAARKLGKELTEELDQAMEEASSLQDDTVRPQPAPPRAPRNEVERCPVCSLRTFTFQKGTIRECADCESGFEALYHCLTCEHEGWHEIE
ncbi:hypothetical protein [Litchfieldella rifensis]|uniref:C2H2-type domain-containing protein n=1 Tax=Litchfieldella rifensis TaxID=762643 RepID=A0ABV7LQ18_9GAMM